MSAGRRQSPLTEQNPRLFSRQSTLSQKQAPKRVPRCNGAMHCLSKPTDVLPDCVKNGMLTTPWRQQRAEKIEKIR
jgi:hypothetical protein